MYGVGELQGKLRIISGKWRSREIRFDTGAGVRPTTDSARETLFNWLQSRIEGARCLDLYAGSGALGFEALSRGAAGAVFVESHPHCVQQLIRTANNLQAESFEIVHLKAEKFISVTNRQFDIIFVDPPFHRGMIERTVRSLALAKCLGQGTLIYLEAEISADLVELPKGWTRCRELKVGSKAHHLIQIESHSVAAK